MSLTPKKRMNCENNQVGNIGYLYKKKDQTYTKFVYHIRWKRWESNLFGVLRYKRLDANDLYPVKLSFMYEGDRNILSMKWHVILLGGE